MARFSDEEVRRYGQQMVLADVGGVGQERLRAATATAHGELAALYLAGAGVGRLTVPSEDIAAAVRQLNPLVTVTVDRALVESVDARQGVAEALATVCAVLQL